MIREFKNIISLLFLSVFLLPSIVKFEHHHDQVLLKVNNENHIPVFRDKCPICNFEFSVFLSSAENIDLPKEIPLDNYCNNYYSRYNSNLSQFSFLLRAPPDSQI
jgi:hypothetical protein